MCVRSALRFALPFLLMSFAAGPATASLLESRFGVTLSLQQITSYCSVLGGDYTRHVFSNAWEPTSPTADYVVSDYTAYWSPTNFDTCGSSISGGEPYDVEAIYFDNDTDNLYVSIVTSFPGPPGHVESRLSNLLVVTGDLAVDFGINGAASGIDPFSYDYGINLNNELRQGSNQNALPNGSPALSGAIYQTQNSDWYTGTPSNDAATQRQERTNFDPAYGSFAGSFEGTASVSYELVDFGGPLENYAATYLFEATIPLASLPALQDGDTVGLQYVMGCRNDGSSTNHVLRLQGDLDIPEPETWALMMIGIVVLAVRRRRSRLCPQKA